MWWMMAGVDLWWSLAITSCWWRQRDHHGLPLGYTTRTSPTPAWPWLANEWLAFLFQTNIDLLVLDVFLIKRTTHTRLIRSRNEYATKVNLFFPSLYRSLFFVFFFIARKNRWLVFIYLYKFVVLLGLGNSQKLQFPLIYKKKLYLCGPRIMGSLPHHHHQRGQREWVGITHGGKWARKRPPRDIKKWKIHYITHFSIYIILIYIG